MSARNYKPIGAQHKPAPDAATAAGRFPADALDMPWHAQQAAIMSSLRASATPHAIDYRVSIPTGLWGSWYVVMLAGRERRNAARLAAEGQTSLSRRTVLISAALLVLLAAALFGALCALYLVKSLLGIDLFPGPSPLHALYVLMRRGGS